MISNGCGASVGLEAGYTQIGSGAASLLGQFLNLRRNDLRLIVGCGAAAAIAAAFGAPITGAFYACELIVGVYAVASAAPILAASLAGALTAQYLGGAPYSLEISKVGTRRSRAISAADRAGADREHDRHPGDAQLDAVRARVRAALAAGVDQARHRRRHRRRPCDRHAAGARGRSRRDGARPPAQHGDRFHRHGDRAEADRLPGLAGVGFSRRLVLLFAVRRQPARKVFRRRRRAGRATASRSIPRSAC